MGELVADPETEAFLAHRNMLFTVAYEMLGSAADAEDVLQETWLRWVKADVGQVRDQRAYLVQITTRQSINRLRSMRRRREAYVGPWLPEPLLTTPDVAENIELAESVSMALMLVLETLSPTERAVFVLREAFGLGYGEIAVAVGKTSAAVRQIAHRAPSDHRRREGGPFHRWRPGQDRCHSHRWADRGQRQPGSDSARERRVRRRLGGARRGRPRHRSLLRPQPRQADPRRDRDLTRPAMSTVAEQARAPH
ncbi:sigma-70 family RNA polymerase sigma factor [Actinomadura sp. NPDC048032]|uniref:sigma-70 family RNA polymerase sigma factor n=1 Tax=Actinomadura sp. NPDC048032 TaxID=3155747 RepID=UPI0033DD044E